MIELQEKQIELLEDTFKYYTECVLRRCRDDHNCAYSERTLGLIGTNGCAIGRLLSDELKENLDKLYPNVSVDRIFHLLPLNIQYYKVKFLTELQNWHDTPIFWLNNKLTNSGYNKIEEIREDIINNKYD